MIDKKRRKELNKLERNLASLEQVLVIWIDRAGYRAKVPIREIALKIFNDLARK